VKTVYVDNNATTKVAPEVLEVMLPYFSEYYGNPSSMHFFGGQVQKKVDEARARVADFLGAEPSEIVFTSCGTESDNAAILGTLDSYPEKRHLITTRVEHPAVGNVSTYLGRKGYRITELSVDREGRLDVDELRESLTDETTLVTIMYANNETGVIFPIEEIGEVVKAKGIPFHTDAVQAAGKIPLNMRKSKIDTLSISGHKLHAPKGIGVLYVRRGTALSPFMIGGHQEGGKRAGTENVAGIVAIGKACELAQKYMAEENDRVCKLRDKLEAGLLATCLDARLNGDPDSRLPNTTNISFEFVEGEAILLMMDHLGIAASSGSACTSGSLEPSHVLRAMGVPFTAVHGSIRFSLSRFTTEEEIDYVIREMPPIIKRLREISMFSAGRDKTPETPYERKPQLGRA
jgi:cysteine desulfurase